MGTNKADIASLFHSALNTLDGILWIAKDIVEREVLQIQIELEKVRLLIWGEAVGLIVGSDIATDALEREDVRSRAAALLLNLGSNLDSEEAISARYGLVAFPTHDTLGNDVAGPSKLDRVPRFGTTFKDTFDKFRNDLTEKQEDISLWTATKWVARDEGKFQRRVESLRRTNNRLSDLTPEVKERTSIRLFEQIMESENEAELRYMFQASDGEDILARQTSEVRLQELDSVGKREGWPRATGDLATTRARPTESLSFYHDQTFVRSRETSRPREPDSHALYNNDGALTIHQVIKDGRPDLVRRLVGHKQPESPSLKTLEHDSFHTLHIPPNLLPFAGPLLDNDPEADPEYDGWAPASVSLAGFAREFWYHDESRKLLPEKTRLRNKGLPAIANVKILERWGKLQKQGGLGSEWTKEKGWREVREVVGDSEFRWLNTTERYEIRHQITDLLSVLSRPNAFPSLKGGSIGFAALQPILDPANARYTVMEFVLQMLLAKELSLRLQRDRRNKHLGVTTDRVYELIAADLWMKGVRMDLDEKGLGMLVETETRRGRKEGMLHFAERMRWPHIDEAREILERFALDGQSNLGVRTWEWMAGLVLPGSMFAASILFGLVAASPSIVNSPLEGGFDLSESNYGFLLSKVSYWRARSVVGRVLAPLVGVNECGGWIGPCIPASGTPTPETSGRPTALVELSAGASTFEHIPWVTATPSDPADVEWDIHPPSPPSASSAPAANVRLRRIHLFQPAPTPTQRSSHPPSLATVTFDVTTPSEDYNIILPLHSNPAFIAPPPCEGTHRVTPHHRDDYATTVVKAEDLQGPPAPGTKLPERGVLVVDANGDNGTNAGAGGEREALARAWCAHQGWNAVVWNQGCGCCYKCALMMASREGLGADVMIAGRTKSG